MRIPGADKAADNLLKWSARDEWNRRREQVFAQHFEAVCDSYDMTMEEIAALLGESFGMIFGCVLEDFFSARFGEEGANVIDDYLKRRGWREKVAARRYLAALRDSRLSLYEVVDLVPGRRMTVKDVIRGGDSVVVEERLGSETSAPWDRIAARIVRVNDANHFTGALLLFSPEAADELLSGMHGILGEREQSHQSVAEKMGTPDFGKDVETKTMLLETGPRTFTRIWLTDVLDRASAPMPEVRNADGDELVFSEVRFPIAGEAPEIAVRLDETDEFERGEPDERRWNWYGQGSPSMGPAPTDAITFDIGDDTGRPVLGNMAIEDEAVVLRANSQKRADRGRDLLLSRLDGLVGKPLTSHQTVEALLEERGDRPPPNNEIPPEAAEQTIHAYMDRHYRRLLDEPLAYLDDKTPRQAAKTKKGRGRVVDWLKKLENTEARRAAGQGQRPCDSRWMWRELRLDDLR